MEIEIKSYYVTCKLFVEAESASEAYDLTVEYLDKAIRAEPPPSWISFDDSVREAEAAPFGPDGYEQVPERFVGIG